MLELEVSNPEILNVKKVSRLDLPERVVQVLASPNFSVFCFPPAKKNEFNIQLKTFFFHRLLTWFLCFPGIPDLFANGHDKRIAIERVLMCI